MNISREKVSQVQLLQFSIHKIAQIILQSRCIFPQEEIAKASFDKRFNLQIPDYVSIRNEVNCVYTSPYAFIILYYSLILIGYCRQVK